jgi:hypothetical protein
MTDKQKIIAGVGLLAGAGILYLLLRKPAQPPGNGGNGNGGEECLVDTDCPDNYVCVDGQCIPM